MRSAATGASKSTEARAVLVVTAPDERPIRRGERVLAQRLRREPGIPVRRRWRPPTGLATRRIRCYDSVEGSLSLLYTDRELTYQ